MYGWGGREVEGVQRYEMSVRARRERTGDERGRAGKTGWYHHFCSPTSTSRHPTSLFADLTTTMLYVTEDY